MKYSRVYLDAIGYELPPVVVTTAELEDRLAPVYESLRIPEGQLEAMTGIVERRWWEAGYPLSRGAAAAGRKALQSANVDASDIDVLIYAGVCRESFEPATACKVAEQIGIGTNASLFDISNACLGVLNGIVDVANRIELGQIRAGLVVSCETSRDINEVMIDHILKERSMDAFKSSLATLTGGSGAVAVLVTDGSFAASSKRKLLGGVSKAAPQFSGLCHWGLRNLQGIQSNLQSKLHATLQATIPQTYTQFMSTDSVAVLKYGVELGLRTWTSLLTKMGWAPGQVDKVICHQVGSGHRDGVLKAFGIPQDKDFSTYEYLGNMGTVSLLLTAAIAEEREFLQAGDRVGFLGIGSGLNCLMLGMEW